MIKKFIILSLFLALISFNTVFGAFGVNPRTTQSWTFDPFDPQIDFYEYFGSGIDFNPYADNSIRFNNTGTFVKFDAFNFFIPNYLQNDFPSGSLNITYINRNFSGIGLRVRLFNSNGAVIQTWNGPQWFSDSSIHSFNVGFNASQIELLKNGGYIRFERLTSNTSGGVGLINGRFILNDGGYQSGFTKGYDTAEADVFPVAFQQGFNIGFDDGFNEGFDEGFDEGFEGFADSGGFGFAWIQTFFSLFTAIFSITLLPGLSVGTIVAIPIVLSLIFFILKLIRG